MGSLPRVVDTPERRSLFDRAARWAGGPWTGIAAEGEPGRVNRRLVQVLGDDLLPRLFPARLGGSRENDEASAVELCLLREALATGFSEAETALALQGLGAYPILQSGSEDLARRWIPRVASGEAVAAVALTEPEAGSDVAAIRLRAKEASGGFELWGAKTWISNAPEADVYTLFGRTSEEGAGGVTAFVVPGDSEGLSGRPLESLSRHPVGTLELEGVFVPNHHVLGDVGGGFKVAMRTLDLFRPSVGAFAIGMARAALDAARDHAGAREAFGRTLRGFQAVSHRLAEMATRIEAARLLVYEAAAAYDAGERVTKLSAMAKLHATETAQEVIDGAIQIHGARALEKGHL
ncbi:MAG: acyl-CoA dehydrogenase family protein, partial [Actinomycetota bacterium]